MPTALTAATRPQSHSIQITRADSFEIVFQLVDSAGDAISLAGLQGVAQVRTEHLPAGTLLATLTVAVDQSAASQPTTGYVTVSANGVTTDQAISGVWELELNDGTPTFDFRKTIAFGAFSTTPQVAE